ncbi:CBS domain-containing protein [Leptolyngbya sp. FACHB-711]|jgi:CBS domain-containing protein|uniref:CBS domain-containing protein n=1 Tax=unclassified Leptolyngbya TaxID=2650499 RepID=UPI0016860E80|nr:CBS domain-containing protein [Leptolyngbya sp. FACHB-711]MBD1850429.1 CBS domain-containing protein [Cyanobacteria bacterium FACHB-502]MBD2025888.1 CBS domain-containing protein [Leptolyngbya sp. FACHB-711]
MVTTVADVMTADPIVVKPETPLNEAIQILAEKRISGLPVVNDSGSLVGVISETDLMWQETGATPPAYIKILDSVIYLENPARYERELHKALGQTVGEVMTDRDIVTIKPDKSLREAAQLMHDRSVHRLPVLSNDGKLIGILTRGDIVRFMAAQQGMGE